MDLGFVAERVRDAIVVFLVAGGLPIATMLLGLFFYAAVRWNWSWLLVSIGLSYAAWAAFWIWSAPQIEQFKRRTDQIYATHFLWGALFCLTLIALVGIVIRSVRHMRTANRPEHP